MCFPGGDRRRCIDKVVKAESECESGDFQRFCCFLMIFLVKVFRIVLGEGNGGVEGLGLFPSFFCFREERREVLCAENWSVTAAFEYEIAEDFVSDTLYIVHTKPPIPAQVIEEREAERRVNLKMGPPFLSLFRIAFVFVPVFSLLVQKNGMKYF